MDTAIKDLILLVGMVRLARRDNDREAMLRYIAAIGQTLNKLMEELS